MQRVYHTLSGKVLIVDTPAVRKSPEFIRFYRTLPLTIEAEESVRDEARLRLRHRYYVQ